MARVARAMVAVAVAMAAGCGPIARLAYQNPVVTVRDVRVHDIGLTGGTVDVILSVYNPNRFALDASRITYSLMVDSVPFGSGASASRFVVQRQDSLDVPLPLTFTWTGVGAAGRSLLATGTVPYHVTGDITVGSAVGTFTLPYDRSGTIAPFSGSNR